jgi:hypothetical protein
MINDNTEFKIKKKQRLLRIFLKSNKVQAEPKMPTSQERDVATLARKRITRAQGLSHYVLLIKILCS